MSDDGAAGAVHSLETDRERARAVAERGLILRTTVGSLVHGLRKYCRLALKGSPTVLLPLFVSDEPVVARTELAAPACRSARTSSASTRWSCAPTGGRGTRA